MKPPLRLEIPRLSAQSLSVHQTCERKFALRYQLNRYWPAVDPGFLDEKALVGRELGVHFHRLIDTRALGLDVEPLLAAADATLPQLRALWRRFLGTPHAELPPGSLVWSEQALHFQHGGAPFMVVYDRLVKRGDRWTILDWKTGRQDEAALRDSWQTKLYRFALVEAGEVLGQGPIAPEAVTLVYWEVGRSFPFEFGYDAKAHRALADELADRADALTRPFDPTLDDDPDFPRRRAACSACAFDTLCNARRSASVSAPPRLPRFLLGPDGEA